MNKTSAKTSAKKDEALKMAIEYIDKLKTTGQTNWLEINVIQNACKEALEQPTQRNFCERCGKRASKDPYHIHTCTPPQALEQPSWQGLSDDEINKIYGEVQDNCIKDFPTELYAAWFEALKEKNTP